VNPGSPPALTPIPVIPPPPARPGGDVLRSLGWLADWYRRDFLELGAVDNSPRTARGVIRERLPLWGLGHLIEVAELVATEMITNSVRTTRKNADDHRLPHTPSVRVWLLGGDASVAVLVWDGVRQAPVPRVAGPGDESGRGLSIVEALSSQWDFYFPDLPFTGKVTRAFITQA
jgi:hypothetical protein